MIKEKTGRACILKYVSFALILVFVVVLMFYMSGSSKPFDEVEESVEKVLDTENLVKQEASKFKRNFGLNAADYDGVMYYSSGFSISADEVLMIKVKDSEQIQEITSAIEKRIESRKNDFEGYAPEEVKLLEDAVQSVRGNYVFFAAAPDAETYLKTFGSSL